MSKQPSVGVPERDGSHESRVDRIAVGTPSEWIDTLSPWIASLRFGVIQLVVHEGRVVQMERTEKVRLSGGGSGKGTQGVA
ncbi:MAG: YezD family protein [Verrucomicrobium sp.]|jgi:hypothetical protein|nr:YezD family protein [Verrucomicrobium sp.]